MRVARLHLRRRVAPHLLLAAATLALLVPLVWSPWSSALAEVARRGIDDGRGPLAAREAAAGSSDAVPLAQAPTQRPVRILPQPWQPIAPLSHAWLQRGGCPPRPPLAAEPEPHFRAAQVTSLADWQVRFDPTCGAMRAGSAGPSESSAVIGASGGTARGRVCIATAEYEGFAPGAVGSAMTHLARFLLVRGFDVRVVYAGVDLANVLPARLRELTEHGVCVSQTPHDARMRGPGPLVRRRFSNLSLMRISFLQVSARRLYDWLRGHEHECDVLVYHEYQGLGAFVANAKRQGLAFAAVVLVPVLHGPHLLALEEAGQLARSPEDLVFDHMERVSVERADLVVAASRRVADFAARARKWALPAGQIVIPHVRLDAFAGDGEAYLGGCASPPPAVSGLAYIGEDDGRAPASAELFCDAVDALYREDRPPGAITFFFANEPYVQRRAAAWNHTRVAKEHANSTMDALRAARAARALAVLAAPRARDTAALTLALAACVPFVATDVGDARELVLADDAAAALVAPRPRALAARLADALARGAPVPRPASGAAAAPRRLEALMDLAVARAREENSGLSADTLEVLRQTEPRREPDLGGDPGARHLRGGECRVLTVIGPQRPRRSARWGAGPGRRAWSPRPVPGSWRTTRRGTARAPR